jgi:Flp pilus assembly protein TadB
VTLVLRAVMAAVGVALLGAAAGAASRARAQPSAIAGRGRAWPAERALVAVARLVRPVGVRSALLARMSAAPITLRRLALTGEGSWVSRSALALARTREPRRAQLDNAIRPGPDQLLAAMAALRAASIAISSCAVLPVAWLGGALPGSLAACAALASGMLPDAALAHHARRAGRRVDIAMPVALELLAACCRGGLALESALAVTAAHAPQPLRGVLDRARRRQRAGEAPAAALRLEAEAVGVDEVAAVGLLVDRHHQLGLPLEAPLLARAQSARARARVAALARAGRGVPLASLLVATVIAPCCVGVLATWVVLALVGQAGLG